MMRERNNATQDAENEMFGLKKLKTTQENGGKLESFVFGTYIKSYAKKAQTKISQRQTSASALGNEWGTSNKPMET